MGDYIASVGTCDASDTGSLALFRTRMGLQGRQESQFTVTCQPILAGTRMTDSDILLRC